MRRAFTTRYSGRVGVLKTKVGISLPVTEEQATLQPVGMKEYVAIWDTGATNSVITKKVVDDLGLKPTGMVEMRHAGGKSMANAYLVNVVLPNNVMVISVRVTEGLLIDENPSEQDRSNVLVGMDIISMGDFAVTNHKEKTMMSFAIPSVLDIDFVPEAQEQDVMQTGNRQQRRAFQAAKRKGSV